MIKGFTLAEVLVTLGIIGVISAMTLPTLVKNHQRQVYSTQAHKFYNEMSQAIDLYINDTRAVNLRETPLAGNSTNLRKFFNDYFKIVKDCNTSYQPCFANEYRTIDGSKTVNTYNYSCNVVVMLTSGVTICADTQNTDATTDEDGNIINGVGLYDNQVIDIEFDINGTQGPNIYGRDYFNFQIMPNGNIVSLAKEKHENGVNTSEYLGFLGVLMENGWKMDY